MDWAKAWIGLAGGGAGGGLILGGGAFYLDLMNLNSVAEPDLHVVVICKRVGAMAHIAGQHAIALLVGVSAEHEVEGLTSSGVDFAFDVGFKIGDAIKSGGKLAKLINMVVTASGKAAQQEAGKKLTQELMGDLAVDKRGRAFYMITTPAGAGLGGGLWYEWQEIVALGGRKAWSNAPPKWKLENRGNQVYLVMKDIPEQDGASFEVQVRVKSWGQDYKIRFGDPGLNWGECVQGKVQDHELCHAMVLPDKGLSLTRQVQHYITHGIGSISRHGVYTKRKIEIGIDARKGLGTYWESKDYVEVDVDGTGRIVRSYGTIWKK